MAIIRFITCIVFTGAHPKLKPRHTEHPCVLNSNSLSQSVSFLVFLCFAFLFPVCFCSSLPLVSECIWDWYLLSLVGLVFISLRNSSHPLVSFLTQASVKTFVIGYWTWWTLWWQRLWEVEGWHFSTGLAWVPFLGFPAWLWALL